MGKSDLLRVHDVRGAYRLIGECRDVGSDPDLWHARMFEGLQRLLGARAVVGGEGWWLRAHSVMKPVSAYDAGLDAAARAQYRAFVHEHGPSSDPGFQALQRMRGRLITVARRQVVSDAAWYRSVLYNDYLRPAGIDGGVMSVCQVSDTGAISAIHAHRGVGERKFSTREACLLNFFHDELRPLIGRALVSATEPRPEKLSPRLRQTLACLLEGDSEKQVAARLGLSLATTHQYVTALYGRFRVHSRAQLLAYALKRASTGQWKSIMQALGAGRLP